SAAPSPATRAAIASRSRPIVREAASILSTLASKCDCTTAFMFPDDIRRYMSAVLAVLNSPTATAAIQATTIAAAAPIVMRTLRDTGQVPSEDGRAGVGAGGYSTGWPAASQAGNPSRK